VSRDDEADRFTKQANAHARVTKMCFLVSALLGVVAILTALCGGT